MYYNKAMSRFQKEVPFEKRITEAKKIREKFPDKIPIIIESIQGSDTLQLDKIKYLVPFDTTVGQLILILRERMKLAPQKTMFLFINNNILPTNKLMGEIYDQYKSNDYFVYGFIASDNFYG